MKKIFLKLLIIYLFIFISFCKKKISEPVIVEKQGNSKNYSINEYYSVKNNLPLREFPNSTSKVITSINKCEKVTELMLESENNHFNTNESDYINILLKSGLKGFVSKNDIKLFDNDSRSPFLHEFEYNHEPFNIIRTWAFYIDDPNIIIEFNVNNKGILESSFNVDEDGNMIITRTNFTYSYDGCCKIIALLEIGKTLEFDVIKYANTNTILLNCMYADPDLKL